MVEIIQDFIPKGRRNRPGYKLTSRYITIHDTGNTNTGADAKAHATYLKGATAASIPSSWHFTVDDQVIVQHLPLNENGWHAGDGANGTGNRQSIGIEICENKDGDRTKAEANATWLVAKLLKDFGLTISAVKQHYDWNKKNCPRVLRSRKNGWGGFLAAVEQHLKPAKPVQEGGLYRVQVGAFSVKANAEACLAKAQAAGFKDAFIVADHDPVPASKTTPAPAAPAIKVGSKVKIKADAVRYSTGEKIPDWVKGKTYTVQQLEPGKVLLKEIYSWVNLEDVALI